MSCTHPSVEVERPAVVTNERPSPAERRDRRVGAVLTALCLIVGAAALLAGSTWLAVGAFGVLVLLAGLNAVTGIRVGAELADLLRLRGRAAKAGGAHR